MSKKPFRTSGRNAPTKRIPNHPCTDYVEQKQKLQKICIYINFHLQASHDSLPLLSTYWCHKSTFLLWTWAPLDAMFIHCLPIKNRNGLAEDVKDSSTQIQYRPHSCHRHRLSHTKWGTHSPAVFSWISNSGKSKNLMHVYFWLHSYWQGPDCCLTGGTR